MTNQPTLPLAGWMYKLSGSSQTLQHHHGRNRFSRMIIRPRWQLRFFVLLDTELRYYKDEKTEVPSLAIPLSEMICVPLKDKKMYSFRLEPKQSGTIKPLSLACSSKDAMLEWMVAIQASCRRNNNAVQFLSLSQRRGVCLPPIRVIPSQSSSSSSSSSSISTKTPVSPVGGCVKAGPMVQQPQERKGSWMAYSPTFLLYKKRFHL